MQQEKANRGNMLVLSLLMSLRIKLSHGSQILEGKAPLGDETVQPACVCTKTDSPV